MKLKQFQTFVRERYHLNTRDMTDEFVQSLAQRSSIADSDIRKIALFEKRIAYNDITEDAMVELHRLVSHFYKNCK
jgi:predicted nucleic acid-binding OB-fold protein